MLLLLRRIFTMSLFLSVLFVGVSSGNAFASPTLNHSQKIVNAPKVYSWEEDCYPFVTDNQSGQGIRYNTYVSASGDTSDCPGSFLYVPVSPGNNQITGSWMAVHYGYSSTSCNIDAWIPLGSLASATNARYDFWGGLHQRWIGWIGHDINQDTVPYGWYRIATNLPFDIGIDTMLVTLHNDGGSGNLAFAGMRFACS